MIDMVHSLTVFILYIYLNQFLLFIPAVNLTNPFILSGTVNNEKERYNLLYDQALGEQKRLKKEISTLKAELAAAPDGYLQCHKNKENYVWRVKYKRKKPVVYLPASETILAGQLAEKTYKSALLQEDELDLINVSSFLNNAQKILRRSAMLLNNEGFRKLLPKNLIQMSPDVSAWASEKYPSTAGHDETLIIRSATGRMVRSKSEAFIDWALYSAKLPYRYECDLQIGAFVMHPDFTILHPVSKEIYLWEHLGLMDNEQYIKNALTKLQLYIGAGYIPMANLILTSETAEHPLDQTLVVDLISHYFS